MGLDLWSCWLVWLLFLNRSLQIWYSPFLIKSQVKVEEYKVGG